MRMAGILLIVAACQSTNYESFTSDSSEAVTKALAEKTPGDAALSTGRAIYWMSGTPLRAERAALLAALRAAPYESAVAENPPYARVVPANDDGVVAWLRSEIFEMWTEDGILRVERVQWPREPAPSFRLSVRRKQTVWYAGSKRDASIERAWKRLERACRNSANPVIEGTVALDRPLDRVRDIGIDFRGISGVNRQTED